jgi:hypothetical protein
MPPNHFRLTGNVPQPIHHTCASQANHNNNRLHLDIAVADVAAEVERISVRGATVEHSTEVYTVMKDLEGNQFCIVCAPLSDE